jgi:Na+-transporting methylmalonyl-CoA/oxaloacetate decarboxylase gamma subunit
MDDLILGLQIMVFGFSVVLLTLYLLYLILQQFSRFLNGSSLKPPLPLSGTEQAPVRDLRQVAAVTAAVAVCLSKASSGSALRIVSIEPIDLPHNPSVWVREGRKALMEKRRIRSNARKGKNL